MNWGTSFRLFLKASENVKKLRLGKEGADEALKLPAVREFDITGRPMKGWAMVEQEGLRATMNWRPGWFRPRPL